MATNLSRSQEKEQLQNLNDRLATYIDRVRQLESENQRLNYQVRITEETITKERNNFRAVYEAELADARRLLDETAKDKARLQINAGKYKIQCNELNARVKKLEDDLKLSEERRLCSESLIQDLTGSLNVADLQRKHWEDASNNLRKENVELRNQLESVRKQLEEEKLLRIDTENRIKSLREEFQFNKQLFEQELDEKRCKRQTEITEINSQLEGKYESKLQDGLRQMRQQLSIQLEMNRKEIEEFYERKIQTEKDARDRATAARAGDLDRLQRFSAQVEIMEKECAKYANLVNELQKKIRDLESDLQQERDAHYDAILQKEDEIQDLRNEIQQMMQDYQDLMDTKIQLDVEIEAYRRLLESEETRLRLTTPDLAPPRIVRRGLKRQRPEATWKTVAETKGDVEIVEHDANGGEFVRLRNKGTHDVAIGGWDLKRQVDGGDVVCFKFQRQSIMKPGATVTVWSANSGVAHAPPTDFVMKKGQHWPTGNKVRSWLVGGDGDGAKELAFRESFFESGAKIRRYSYSIGQAAKLGGAMALVGSETDQRCLIM